MDIDFTATIAISNSYHTQYTPYNYSSDYNNTIPRCVVDIMTSGNSTDRLSYIFENYGYHHPLRKSGVFHFRIVYSQDAHVDQYTDIEHLVTPCKDISKTNEGINCRVNYAQENFPPNVPWHYRAMDDSFLNLDNLLLMMSLLEKIYNPMTDIVCRCFANWHFSPNPYVGGGAGWLMSNAFVTHIGKEIPSLIEMSDIAAFSQDDTTLYLLLANMFPSTEMWSDCHFVDQVLKNNYDANLKCESRATAPFKRIDEAVALHIGPNSFLSPKWHPRSDNGKKVSEFMLSANPTKRYIYDHKGGASIACISSPTAASVPLTIQYLNRSYHLVRPFDFAGYPRSWWKVKSYSHEVKFKNQK